jgi:hypothetical protein
VRGAGRCAPRGSHGDGVCEALWWEEVRGLWQDPRGHRTALAGGRSRGRRPGDIGGRGGRPRGCGARARAEGVEAGKAWRACEGTDAGVRREGHRRQRLRQRVARGRGVGSQARTGAPPRTHGAYRVRGTPGHVRARAAVDQADVEAAACQDVASWSPVHAGRLQGAGLDAAGVKPGGAGVQVLCERGQAAARGRVSVCGAGDHARWGPTSGPSGVRREHRCGVGRVGRAAGGPHRGAYGASAPRERHAVPGQGGSGVPQGGGRGPGSRRPLGRGLKPPWRVGGPLAASDASVSRPEGGPPPRFFGDGCDRRESSGLTPRCRRRAGPRAAQL